MESEGQFRSSGETTLPCWIAPKGGRPRRAAVLQARDGGSCADTDSRKVARLHSGPRVSQDLKQSKGVALWSQSIARNLELSRVGRPATLDDGGRREELARGLAQSANGLSGP